MSGVRIDDRAETVVVKPAPQPLDYAGPVPRAFDWARGPGLAVLVLVLFASLWLASTVSRIVPGGPFLSVHGDVVPLLACAATFHLAWRRLRPSGPGRRVVLAGVLVASVLVIYLVVSDVFEFWIRPYARGTLVAW